LHLYFLHRGSIACLLSELCQKVILCQPYNGSTMNPSGRGSYRDFFPWALGAYYGKYSAKKRVCAILKMLQPQPQATGGSYRGFFLDTAARYFEYSAKKWACTTSMMLQNAT